MEAESLADTEGSDPKEITEIVITNTDEYEDPADHCTSGALSRLVEVANKLPLRMRDEENVEYIVDTAPSLSILKDWINVTSNVFNHYTGKKTLKDC
jgi:hypothetical protein